MQAPDSNVSIPDTATGSGPGIPTGPISTFGFLNLLMAIVALIVAGAFLASIIDRGPQDFDNWFAGHAAVWPARTRFATHLALGIAGCILSLWGGLVGILSLRRSARAHRVGFLFGIVALSYAVIAIILVVAVLVPMTQAMWDGWPGWAKRPHRKPDPAGMVTNWGIALCCCALWSIAVLYCSRRRSG